jgi:hypothetical protein
VIRLPTHRLLDSPLRLVSAYSSPEGTLDLPGYRQNIVSDAKRPPTPGAPNTTRHNAQCRAWPSVLEITWARSISYNISGLNTFTVWGPPRSIAPRLLSCLRIKLHVAAQPARLDTGPMASHYPGGIHTRLF